MVCRVGDMRVEEHTSWVNAIVIHGLMHGFLFAITVLTKGLREIRALF